MDAALDVSIAMKKTRTEIIQGKKIIRHFSHQRRLMYRKFWVKVSLSTTAKSGEIVWYFTSAANRYLH